MGQYSMKWLRRTGVAAILVAAAVALPLTAWFILGSRGVDRESSLLRSTAELRVSQATVAVAQRAADRLEAMREAESRRPFFHYQTHFHDPQSDCACSSVTSSPLAHGPRDPAIWAYVQINPDHHVTLPTLEESLHHSGVYSWLGSQADILTVIEPVMEEVLLHPLPSEPSRHETVSFDSWIQNMELAGVQCDLATVQDAVDSLHRSIGLQPSGEEVLIDIGPMEWRPVTIGDAEHLAAFRGVSTPTGLFVQGFIVEPGQLGSMIEDAALPAVLLPGRGQGRGTAAVPINGVEWHARVDGEAWLREAADAGRALSSGFRRTFFLGSLAALIAAAALILLIWQTERMSEQRARFAAAAAHELRTPLAGLRLYSDLLGNALGDPHKTKEYAQRLSTETERMGLVVSNILGYARIERRGEELPTEPRNLVADVRDFLKDMEPSLTPTGVRVRLKTESDQVSALFNRDAMAHIVQNLVDNAEKHCRQTKDRVITVSVTSDDGAAVVTVRDNGPGVPQEAQAKLFEAFTGTSDSGGLGLGLSLVRTLAEAQHGHVWHQSPQEGGSIFGVSLPIPA